jgi:two-component system, OmpR family, sensor histidine kinase SenX3
VTGAARTRRRSAIWIAALAAGLAGLLWGLAGLQGIFIGERDEARAALAAERANLERDAQKALAARLDARLDEASERAEAALRDPLAPAGGLYLRRGGRTLLPRRYAFAAGEATPAKQLLARLVDPDAPLPEVGEADTAWGARLLLLRDLQAAVREEDTARIERVVRGILAHRSRYVVSVERDLPYAVAVVEFFAAEGQPSRELLARLLRDGLDGADGAHLPGLQRRLLERRDRFSEPDARFLAQRIAALSDAARVPSADFLDQMQADIQAVPAALQDLEAEGARAPVLVAGGAWLAAVTSEGVLGVKVDMGELIEQVAAELSRGKHLQGGDRLELAATIPPRATPEQLAVSAVLPRLSAAEVELERRYWLKTLLGLLLGAGALGIVGLVVLLLRHERRFLALRSEFVAAVSHDLRTPLASVRVMAETLERKLKNEPAARDYPARIVREADRLSARVDNVLSFNRLEGKRPRLRLSDVPVGDVVASVAEEVANHAPAALEVDTAGVGDLVVCADAELFRLVLLNLAANAVKYCERDPIRIEVTAERGGAALVLRLRDNAAGIPRQDWERVFTEFYRRPAGGDGERGFGLGLAICRRVMALHRGGIRVVESSGSGTVFELSFPPEAEVRWSFGS